MLKYSLFTNQGSREKNEDSINQFSKGKQECFVLCDGLGGHGMGNIASKLVADTVIDVFKNSHAQGKELLSQAFSSAQEALIAKQNALNARSKLKTTAVIMVTDGNKVSYGHIGDSRLYVFSNNTVAVRTRDHSVPEMLVKIGEITENQIRFHEDRNRVLRAMGTDWEKPMYEISPDLSLKDCQAFLLCTDGFWELIDESQITAALKNSKTPEAWIDKMCTVITKNGAGKNMDNFSAIAVMVK